MIIANRYSGQTSIPVKVNVDEPKKLVSLADALKQAGAEMNKATITGPGRHRQKQKVTLRQSEDAQLACRRMITQGRRSCDIISSIKKNFNINVHPCDLSAMRKEMGIESPHANKGNGAVQKKSSAPVAPVAPASASTPAPAPSSEPKAMNIAQLIKMLQRELKRSGIASAVVHAKGGVKLQMG